MAVYVISDTHFAHSNILRYRTSFKDIEEHDWTITNNILSICGKRDSLYILGDVCIYKNGMPYLEEIANAVEHLHIVLGNHDQERKGAPSVEDYTKLCKGVYGLKKYKSSWLSHAPLHPEELRGKMNIHGHIHDKTIYDSRYFNASCEMINYKPVNISDVLNCTLHWTQTKNHLFQNKEQQC